MRNQGDTGKNGGIANIPGNYRTFDLNGEINVKVSKSRISENTETIIPEFNESKYKNMTQKVEKIKITPIHIIATVSTQIDNIDSKNLNNIIYFFQAILKYTHIHLYSLILPQFLNHIYVSHLSIN